MDTLQQRTPARWVGANARAASRPAAAGLVALGLLASLPLSAPLGRLRDPLVLVLVLPPLAVALESLGWGQVAGRRIRAIERPILRVLGAYGLWLATSALLTLDVAAVAAASVGLTVGGRRAGERDAQLGAAIVGANVGSLLFPFSNLTNLVLLAGAGISFRAYVGAAALPQLATAVAAGAVLFWRGRRRLRAPDAAQDAGAQRAGPAPSLGAPARLAGVIVLGGSAAAVATGFAGGDIAAAFAVTAALVAALAVGSGHATGRQLASSIPALGIGVILAAALLGGPMAGAAAQLPVAARLQPSPAVLTVTALLGGVLAAAMNNLPAAAFGAVWLRGAPPPLVIAYLVGTNVLALITPHGSLATVLSRSVAARAGHPIPHGPYLRSAWRFALAGSLAALAALAIFG